MLTRSIAALRGRAKDFCASERGNIAMTFALVSIPLVVAVGGLVDYTRSTMARMAMQDALDATSLALSRQSNVSTMTADAMKTWATNYFKANYTNQDVPTVTLTPSYDSTGPSVTVGGSGAI